MKSIEHNGKYLVLAEDFEGLTGVIPERYLANGSVWQMPSAPRGAQIVDVDKVLDSVRQLGDEIKAQMVSMDECIDLVMIALISRVPIFLLSLPGAGKSTIARLIGQGVNGKYFRINLTSETSTNDLFGMVDPISATKGVWARRLSGVATARVAMIDEVFKGSETVRQLLLDVFEERTFDEADETNRLPLVIGLMGSNETGDADEIGNAFWDRTILKYDVKYPSRDEDWIAMATSGHGTIPINSRLDCDELVLMQGLVEVWTGEMKMDVIKRAVSIRQELNKRSIPVSNRRYLAWLKVATAKALMETGKPATTKSLMVGEHILWISKQNDIGVVQEVVHKLSDPQRGKLMRVKADVETILEEIEGQEKGFEEFTEWKAALATAQGLLGTVTDPDYEDEKEEILEIIGNANTQLLNMASDLAKAEQEKEPAKV